MAWERWAPKPVCTRVPPDCVSIGAKRIGIAFASQTVRPWGLAGFKSANVLTDARRPKLVALQFIGDRSGDYMLDGYRETNVIVRCASLVRRLGIEPGLYAASLDRVGFVIVDFGLRVKP